MDSHAAQRAESVFAVVLVAAAVVLLLIVGVTATSLDGAEIIGLIALALGAVLGLDAWRRSSAPHGCW